MDETDDGSPGRRRITGLWRWFLLTGNRLAVSAVILLGIGTAFAVVGVLELATVTTASRVMWYLNGTVNGLLTLVPISVGVNQIVLSHEFGSIQDLYERRTDVTDFRERVEERTAVTVSSPYASTFFETLLSTIADTARTVQRPADRSRSDEELSADLDRVAGSIGDEADRALAELETNGSSMLQTFLVVLDYDDSTHFYALRRLRKRAADSEGDDETTETLDRLVELFIETDAARQFLKTVVVERQLARLSRLLIYTGVPAVTIAAIGIFTYRDIAGLTLSHTALVGIAGTIIVTTLVPLVILSAYILRVATIARRTAAYGPFVPESDD